MKNIKFNYHGFDHEIDTVIFNDISKQIDIILPIFNDVLLASYFIQKLNKYTNPKDYNLWIIDGGSTDTETLKYLEGIIHYGDLSKKKNIDFNVNVVYHRTANKVWNGSKNHGENLNSLIGSGLLTSKNCLLVHSDSLIISSKYFPYILSKIDEGYTAVSNFTNWEDDKGMKFYHCSGLIVDREFLIENEIDCRPNKPKWDTVGEISIKLKEQDKKVFIMPNSRNNTELRQFHAWDHARGCESFDEEIPPNFLIAHEGRGSSQGDRGNWFNFK